MRRVYVAHPYGGKEENKVEVEKIIKSLVEEDVKKGENTLYVSPIHCTGFIYDYVSYEDGMDMCFELLEGCDEILICGKDWKKSTGVCMEYGFAKANGMRIVFHNNVVLTRQVSNTEGEIIPKGVKGRIVSKGYRYSRAYFKDKGRTVLVPIDCYCLEGGNTDV